MNETLCGKSCETCQWREMQQCPGCQTVPGGRAGDCEIAVCCREKGHKACETCGFAMNCRTLRLCEDAPARRQERTEAMAARRQWHKEKAPLLGKWLWISFWLFIPRAVIGLVTNERLSSNRLLGIMGAVFSMVLVCVGALCLIKLAPADARYRTAGWCSIGSGVMAELAELLELNAAGWGLLLLLPAMGISMYAAWQKYSAHAAVLEGLDDELSEKWRKLWKWEVGLILGMFGCLLIILIGPVLGLLALLADAIALLVVSILDLVYLYRTAKLFREYPVEAKEALPDETVV